MEISDGVPNVSTLVARDGWSDWAAAPTPEWARRTTPLDFGPSVGICAVHLDVQRRSRLLLESALVPYSLVDRRSRRLVNLLTSARHRLALSSVPWALTSGVGPHKCLAENKNGELSV